MYLKPGDLVLVKSLDEIYEEFGKITTGTSMPVEGDGRIYDFMYDLAGGEYVVDEISSGSVGYINLNYKSGAYAGIVHPRLIVESRDDVEPDSINIDSFLLKLEVV